MSRTQLKSEVSMIVTRRCDAAGLNASNSSVESLKRILCQFVFNVAFSFGLEHCVGTLDVDLASLVRRSVCA